MEPLLCLSIILRNAFSIFIHRPRVRLRRCESLLCRLAMPFQFFPEVLGITISPRIHQTLIVLGVGIPLFCKRFPLLQCSRKVSSFSSIQPLLQVGRKRRAPNQKNQDQNRKDEQSVHLGNLTVRASVNLSQLGGMYKGFETGGIGLASVYRVLGEVFPTPLVVLYEDLTIGIGVVAAMLSMRGTKQGRKSLKTAQNQRNLEPAILHVLPCLFRIISV